MVTRAGAKTALQVRHGDSYDRNCVLFFSARGRRNKKSHVIQEMEEDEEGSFRAI
jgi:hypothetical protein